MFKWISAILNKDLTLEQKMEVNGFVILTPYKDRMEAYEVQNARIKLIQDSKISHYGKTTL